MEEYINRASSLFGDEGFEDVKKLVENGDFEELEKLIEDEAGDEDEVIDDDEIEKFLTIGTAVLLKAFKDASTI